MEIVHQNDSFTIFYHGEKYYQCSTDTYWIIFFKAVRMGLINSL